MYKKGISIYGGFSKYPLEKNIAYLKLAKSLGYESVFSSFHIAEANTTLTELQTLIDETTKLGMHLTLDISKPIFEKLTLPSNLYALRLDYGFSDEDLINLTNNAPYKIEINASTFTNDHLNQLLEKGLNPQKIKASFNYYPKKHTGHNIEFCAEKIANYHQHHIEVAGFIPTHSDFRPPMFEGLPTVEKHREALLSLAIEELKAIDIDEIIFGDAYASLDELQTLQFHQQDEILLDLKLVNNFTEISYLDNVFKIRIDSNDEQLRISRRVEDILPFNTISRNIFDVTIDNYKFLRYQGEINIILKPLEADERVNVIGHLETSFFLLDKIKQGRPFRFIIKND